MASSDPPPCTGDVRIAIICALKLEYDAVKLTFEHIWEDDKTRDGYGYSTGRIAGHVSLLVCCEAGKASAAGAASSIRSRYRGIKLAIVAGICGGVPGVGTGKELVLGDVVISTSIFQYDYGRRNTDKFRPKESIGDALPVPVREISSFLNMLQTSDAYKRLQSETNRIIHEIQQAEPETYERPEDTKDYLYEAEYVHKHRNSPPCCCDESVVCDEALEATCEELSCEDSFLVQRPCRKLNLQGGDGSTSGSPGARTSVRFGGVGSGDTVMKSGRDRDEMAKRHKLIALEMEGAGIRKHINDSIVVKSVCDYADSHKNKSWQNFAAAAAAASTKALLQQFSCEEEPESPRIHRKYDQIEKKLLALLAAEHERYKDFNPKKVEGTCEWFFKDHRFLEWLNSPSGIIWVSAGPGCGKSVLAKALIDEQRLLRTARNTTVCYFFFKAGEERRTGSSDALSALLHQLFIAKRGSDLIQYAEGPSTSYGETLRHNFYQLWDILTSCAKSSDAGEIVCVLDALDECNERGRQEILMKLRTFDKAQSRLKFLITGRPYDHLEDEFKGLSEKGACIQLDGDDKSEEIREEINLVIDHKVKMIAEHWEHFAVEHRQQLLERLKGMENRTYLWLHLTMDVIEKRRSSYSKYSRIKTLLEQLPLDVFQAYEKILDHSQDQVKAKCLLQIILAAKQPLTLEELNHCFALHEERFCGDVPYDYNDLRAELEPSTTFASTVRNLCGLFISVHDGKVSFIHKTARDFLVTEPKFQTGGWQGKFCLAMAHNVMFVSCVRLISLEDFDALANKVTVKDRSWKYNPWKELRLVANRVLPFVTYAVLNWAYHYKSQDEEGKIGFLKEARNLCYMSKRQGQAQSWFELSEKLRLGTWEAKDNWTDLTLSTFLGLFEIVVHMLDREKVDVNEQGGRHGTAVMCASCMGDVRLVRTLRQHGAHCDASGDSYQTALLAAVDRGHLEVIKCLLEESTGVQVTQEVITAAAKSFHISKDSMSLLLDKFPDVEITQDIILRIAKKKPKFMRLLLERYRENINITPEVLEAAARFAPRETLALLLDMCGDTVEITAKLVEEAAGSSSGNGSLCLLLEKYGDMVQITPNVVLAAAASSEGVEVLEFLLDKFGDKIEITTDVLTTVAAYSSGRETMTFLDEKGYVTFENREHMEEILEAAAGNLECGDAIIAMLLEKHGDLVEVTPSILLEAAQWGSDETMALLLERRGDELQVTQDIIVAAVRRGCSRVKTITLLIEKGREEVRVNQGVLVAAAETGSARTIHFILRRYSSEVELTRDVMRAVKRNAWNQEEILSLFSEEYSDMEEVRAFLRGDYENERQSEEEYDDDDDDRVSEDESIGEGEDQDMDVDVDVDSNKEEFSGEATAGRGSG